jgi:predicted RNA-binding protein with PIN domain
MCIIVFDAYKRLGGEGSEEEINGVLVVYTRENETADAYVEKTTSSLAGKHTVRVVTSDLEEQRIVLGSGGLRVSTREFALELERLDEDIREIIESIR